MTAPSEKRTLRRVLQVAAGLAVGLVLAETAFCARDHGAFPHLNVYVADAKLGVRLRPGGTEKLAFGGSAVASVRINAAGLRGAELPSPAEGEVIVVGDSQVFGLGVEEGETASAELARILGKPVVNAGVPTYGPPEYNSVIEELAATRKPAAVVYVVNFVNDFFEATRPNTERHAAWDGWAVRKETAPTHVSSFPGRALLYNRSHAVYALRRWWYRQSAPEIDDRGGLPSEGTARDLLGRAAVIDAERAEAKRETEVKAALRRVEMRFAEQRAGAAEAALEELISRAFSAELGVSGYGEFGPGGPGISYRSARATPGDIVAAMWGEEGRDTIATAELIRQGALLRTKLEAEVKKRAASDAGFAKLEKVIEERDGATKELATVWTAPIDAVRARSPMTEQIARAKAICDAVHARLVVVGLPMDVMVFPSAFRKYGSAEIDLAPVQVLMSDLIEAAHGMGVTAIDATSALRTGGEDVFLPQEFHLTPKGQAVLARALAAALATPPPPGRPRGLPPGRSLLPRPEEWSVKETIVHGSDAAGCTTKKVREWVSIRCHGRKGDPASRPLGVRVLEGGGGDAIAVTRDGIATLIAPVVAGEDLLAEFFWKDRTQRLRIHFPKDDIVADMGFEAKQPAAEPPAASDVAELCACYKESASATSCEDFLGDPDPGCASRYKGDCKAMLACSLGEPLRGPACPEGEVNAGATGRCRPTCADGACKTGKCTDYQGARLCIAP